MTGGEQTILRSFTVFRASLCLRGEVALLHRWPVQQRRQRRSQAEMRTAIADDVNCGHAAQTAKEQHIHILLAQLFMIYVIRRTRLTMTTARTHK